MNSVVRVVPPVGYPVSLPEAKDYLHVTDDYEDGVINGLIAAATEFLDGPDGILGRAILPQTYEETFDDFRADFRLSFGPVTALEAVSYTDAAGLPQPIEGARLVAAPGTVRVYRASWPSAGPIVVRYTAGSPEAPAPLKMAILLHVGALFANREAVTALTLMELPLAYKMLINPYRRVLV